MISKRLIMGSGRDDWGLPQYTGSYTRGGNVAKGWMILKSSGVMTFPGSGTIERVQCGSGFAGESASSNQLGASQSGGNGGNGGGMWTKAAFSVVKGVAYQVTIASACSSTSAANITTSFGGSTTTTGTGGAGGTKGTANPTSTNTNPTAGQDGPKVPWSNSNPIPELGRYCAGGGGGGAYSRYGQSATQVIGASGGSPGGGAGGYYSNNNPTATGGNATKNTASGGGGGGRRYGQDPILAGTGGKGGSGVVIIRWGYV